MSMKIFVSYRRKLDKGTINHILHRLQNRYGEKNIFFDKYSIISGDEFEKKIRSSIVESDIFLLLVNKEWSDPLSPYGVASLRHITDFVRLEIQLGIRNELPIIPVLIDGAFLPEAKELPEEIRRITGYQTAPLRNDEIEVDFARLFASLDSHASEIKQKKLMKQRELEREALEYKERRARRERDRIRSEEQAKGDDIKRGQLIERMTRAGLKMNTLDVRSQSISTLEELLESQCWKGANSSRSEEKIQNFLIEFPNGKLRFTALAELQVISWENTLKSNTVKDFYNFINRFPNSSRLKQAKNKIIILKLYHFSTLLRKCVMKILKYIIWSIFFVFLLLLLLIILDQKSGG